MQIRLVGPVRAERREASWSLPRLAPREAARHAFKLTPVGYGRTEVYCRLVLPESGALRGAPLAAQL